MLNKTGCTHETERRGSPQTLVVTKTNAEYLASHKAWAQRHDNAKKRVEDLGEDKLQPFLGNMFTSILSLDASLVRQSMTNMQDQGQTSTLASNGNAPNRVLPPITRRKVPSQPIVIDD